MVVLDLVQSISGMFYGFFVALGELGMMSLNDYFSTATIKIFNPFIGVYQFFNTGSDSLFGSLMETILDFLPFVDMQWTVFEFLIYIVFTLLFLAFVVKVVSLLLFRS